MSSLEGTTIPAATMNASINPSPPPAVARPSAQAVNSGIELANIVLAIVKEVGEMLNNIPYVKSLSGVILQIIKIRDEIKANKARCGQIIDKVLRMSKWVYEKLAQIARANQREKLAGLEYHLNQHESALSAVYTELQKHQSSRSLFAKLTNRGMDELNEHDRHLDELNSQLMLDIMLHSTIEQASASGSGSDSNQLAAIDMAMRYLTLAKSYQEEEQWSRAIESYMIALEAYKQIPNLQRQAEIGTWLTYLHIEHGSLVKAEKFGTEALATSKRVNSAVVVGNAHLYLGRIYLYTDRITDARQTLEESLRIFKQENHRIGQLMAVEYLGEVYIELDQLTTAEALIAASAKLELDHIEIPRIMNTLGSLYICVGRFDKAESLLNDALQRFRNFENKSWQAVVLAQLGDVYLKSNRLGDSERVMKSIPDLGIWPVVELHRLSALGELYTIQGKLEDAEASLDAAMAVCQKRQRSSSYEQGNILRSTGTLHVKRGRIDLAIEKFTEAREFHRKAQWVSEQATDLNCLGEAYKMLGRIEEARAALEEAEALMESVREARTLKV